MAFGNVSTGFAFEQARVTLGRIQSDLIEAQRAVSSGQKVDELKDSASDAAGIISARTMLTEAEGRRARLNSLSTRLEVQDAALGEAYNAADSLKQALFKAVTQGNGIGIDQALENAYTQLRSAFNLTYENVYLFGGEQTTEPPVRAASAAHLAAFDDLDSAFNVSERTQEVQFGSGKSMVAAERATDIAGSTFAAIRSLYEELERRGGEFSTQLTAEDKEALTTLMNELNVGVDTLAQARGRNGQKLALVEAEGVRLDARVDLATKTLGDKTDADVAAESVRMTLLQSQYEAAARSFSALKDLSLLNFLS